MRRILLCVSLLSAVLAASAAFLPADAAKPAPMGNMAAMGPMANPAPAPNPPPVTPGCAYQPIDLQKYGMKPYADAPVIHSGYDHALHATLTIAYTDPAKTSIAGCPVKLRTYNAQLVGPTLRVRGGDTMYITVVNDLPESVDSNGKPIPCPMDHNNMMQSLNTTNLHTHGLHVSPSGNSDNIFIEICGHKAGTPPAKQDYVIHIPSNHPPGTFWYHAHVHGSTAVQVSSAMEGAIVIEGNIDQVPQIKAMKEKTLLMQQISYDQNGQIESLGLFSPGSWAKSQRVVTINSQIAPVIHMQPGEIQRWRFIHGGVRETLFLSVPGGGALNEIATDGNTIGRIDSWKSNLEFDPGYRSDILFQAPALPTGKTSMRYFLTSAPVTGARSLQVRLPPLPQRKNLKAMAFLSAVEQPAGTIAVIEVSGAPVTMAMPTVAELAPLAPYKPITDKELTGVAQTMAFSIASAVCGPTGPCQPCDPKVQPKDCVTQFMVNDYPYPSGPVRQMKLNTASVWHLSVDPASVAPEHPFHIHVNPFEMVRAGPDGKPQTVWKDTLLVHQNQPVDVRSRYEDFTGAFVLHCHILDHEDQGMMQKVEIVN